MDERLAKVRGFIDEEGEAVNRNSFNDNVGFSSKNSSKQSVLEGVSIDYSSVDMPAVFDSLKDDNFSRKRCFRIDS